MYTYIKIYVIYSSDGHSRTYVAAKRRLVRLGEESIALGSLRNDLEFSRYIELRFIDRRRPILALLSRFLLLRIHLTLRRLTYASTSFDYPPLIPHPLSPLYPADDPPFLK